MNVTSRVLDAIIVARVGHVTCGFEVGLYPYFDMPEDVKIVPYCAADRESEFTRIRVTTSLGLMSIHDLICPSHVASSPASRREQLL